ncbi:hypothetical protein HU200_059912 [Digitaria exilis]|uniref:Protein GAMETE EXPRESSED 2 n=1 Tax=Digitaria exilis TaxID=1010633 RepID=A0A835ABU3_9POAL|nr:hypothetical protein HU200_059912 [Digitaria exilis]
MLTVKPGVLNIEKSTCSWKHGINTLQIFSKLEIFIYQKDSFGNIVPEIHPFDAQVVETARNLSIPVNLKMEAVADGTQLLSFDVVQPGEFVLTVFDPQLNKRISDTVHKFDVFVGYCDGEKSFANGSGLAHSVAGSTSSFAVFLEDRYSNPSPVDTPRLHVKILAKNGTSYADPIISPEKTFMEGESSNLGPAGQQKIIGGDSTAQASQFKVSYTPQIVGEYEIWILCGNIVINGGNPYVMTVLPGAISMSLSSVVKFEQRVKMSVENEVGVRLVDSFMNPLVSFESKLGFQLKSESTATPVSTTTFVAKEFFDNRNGSYTARYVARNLASYGICVLFEEKQLSPCPFEVNVLPDEYFSDVKDDSVSVWEGESVSFDVLSNDRIAGSKADIANSSSPLHGFVQQFNHVYRYTPFEGFFGNDSFSYTVSDEHNNVVTATVSISVICRPPQFVSLPIKLHVTEDTIGPQFGGFPGIKILYSDITENISVTVTAQSGNVSLALMLMKLQQLSDYVLSISRGGQTGKDLILEGKIEAINGALQFLQYLGNEDFYGDDVIALHVMNRYGVEVAQFPISVEPVNDPPVILAPTSVFFGRNESRKGYQIYNKSRDTFQFSIFDPDLQNFPGNKSHFSLVLSLEVCEGTLTLSLPASIIPTVEVKTEGFNYWRPIQTYVNIANHFVLEGTAIRFRGTVQDCNDAMQQLYYQGPNHSTTLSITVDDLGSYGCYPDCSKMMGTPLSAAKTVRLVKTKHKSLRIDHLAGWLMVTEILTMLCLSVALLYFLFKCIKDLKTKRRDRRTREKRRASPLQSEDVGHCSAPAAVVPSGANRASFRQRSLRSRKQELELQPVSRIRNNGNQDGIITTEKEE